MTEKLLYFPEVQEITGGKSRVTIWRWEKAGEFPKHRKIGKRSVAWLSSEVDAWLQSKIAS